MGMAGLYWRRWILKIMSKNIQISLPYIKMHKKLIFEWQRHGGAQDSSWQRGRQAISRSISSKESNRSIIIRNPSGKVHIFRRCYITQLICSTCNNWSTTRMNLETCFFVLFLITLFWQSYCKGFVMRNFVIDLIFWFYFFTSNQYSPLTIVDTYDSTLAHSTQERESASPMIRRQYIIWTYLSSATSIQF